MFTKGPFLIFSNSRLAKSVVTECKDMESWLYSFSDHIHSGYLVSLFNEKDSGLFTSYGELSQKILILSPLIYTL